MAYTLAICSQKGGVAKTTTAINLSGSLADLGYQVLAVDLDPQGNLGLGFGFRPKELSHTMADVLLNAMPAAEILLPTEVPGLHLLPANKQAQLVERYLPSRPNYQFALKTAIAPLTPQYDFVVLDCPPSLSALTTNALVAANMAILPTQAEYFSAYALKPMLQMLQAVRERYNPALVYRIVLTMFHRRNRAHRIIRSRLEATFGSGLCQTVIETDTKLREATIAGKPIHLFAPKTRSAEQYRTLAQELVAYVQKESIAQTA